MLFMNYKTNRLCLDILSGADSFRVLDFYMRNMTFLEPHEPQRVTTFYTEAFQKANLNYEYNEAVNKKMVRYWISLQTNPDFLIGSVCVQHIMRGAFMSGVLGYKIDSSFLNCGYAFESVTYIIDIMFSEYKLHRLEAYVLETNTPSICLLEKLGFSLEGISFSSVFINGLWQDQLRYSLINPIY